MDSQAEVYYTRTREQVNNANSITELIETLSSRLDPKIPKDGYKRNLQKEINKKFRGNLEKSKAHFIKQLNIAEHDYWEEEIIDWQIEAATQNI